MYFPDKKNKRFTAAILITSILAILCLSILDLGGDSNNNAHPKGLPQGTAYVEAYDQSPANAVASVAAPWGRPLGWASLLSPPRSRMLKQRMARMLVMRMAAVKRLFFLSGKYILIALLSESVL